MCYGFDWTSPLPSEHARHMTFDFPRILADPYESVMASIESAFFRIGPEILLVDLSKSVKTVDSISFIPSTIRHVHSGPE